MLCGEEGFGLNVENVLFLIRANADSFGSCEILFRVLCGLCLCDDEERKKENLAVLCDSESFSSLMTIVKLYYRDFPAQDVLSLFYELWNQFPKQRIMFYIGGLCGLLCKVCAGQSVPDKLKLNVLSVISDAWNVAEQSTKEYSDADFDAGADEVPIFLLKMLSTQLSQNNGIGFLATIIPIIPAKSNDLRFVLRMIGQIGDAGASSVNVSVFTQPVLELMHNLSKQYKDLETSNKSGDKEMRESIIDQFNECIVVLSISHDFEKLSEEVVRAINQNDLTFVLLFFKRKNIAQQAVVKAINRSNRVVDFPPDVLSCIADYYREFVMGPSASSTMYEFRTFVQKFKECRSEVKKSVAQSKLFDLIVDVVESMHVNGTLKNSLFVNSDGEVFIRVIYTVSFDPEFRLPKVFRLFPLLVDVVASTASVPSLSNEPIMAVLYGTLWNYATHSAKEHHRILVETGAWKKLCFVTSSVYYNNDKVVESFSASINNIASEGNNCELLADSSAIESLDTIAEKNRRDAVRKNCYSAILVMCATNIPNRRRAIAIDFPMKLGRFMKDMRTQLSSVAEVSDGILSFSRMYGGQQQFVEAELPRLITCLIPKAVTSPSLLISLVGGFWNFAFDPTKLDGYFAMSVVGIIMTVWKKNITNKDIIVPFCGAIWTLLSRGSSRPPYEAVAEFVKKVCDVNPGSVDAQKCYASLCRIPHPTCANPGHRCTKLYQDKCPNSDLPSHKINAYCRDCFVPQQVYFCEECSRKDFFPVFCVPCFVASHLSRGHHGTLLFLPARCCCDDANCSACNANTDADVKANVDDEEVGDGDDTNVALVDDDANVDDEM